MSVVPLKVQVERRLIERAFDVARHREDAFGRVERDGFELDVRAVEDHPAGDRLHRHAALADADQHVAVRSRTARSAPSPTAYSRSVRMRGVRISMSRWQSRYEEIEIAELSGRGCRCGVPARSDRARRGRAAGSRRRAASRVIVTLPPSTATSSKRSRPRYAAHGSCTVDRGRRVKNGLS